MTSLDIATGKPDPGPDPHEAALVAQAWNAGVAACQRELRATADQYERTFPGAGLPMVMASCYRAAADQLEVMRT